MSVIAIPKSLRDRLGDEGSEGLVEIISAIDERAREDSLRLLSERFERRLSEEIGKVNQRISEEIGGVRAEIGSVMSEVGSVRAELHSVRAELHSVRAELIKWMFIFWVGQVTVLGGLIIGLFTFAG